MGHSLSFWDCGDTLMTRDSLLLAMVHLSFDVPTSMMKSVRDEAERTGKTISEVCRERMEVGHRVRFTKVLAERSLQAGVTAIVLVTHLILASFIIHG